jgi:hypothetical protein
MSTTEQAMKSRMQRSLERRALAARAMASDIRELVQTPERFASLLKNSSLDAFGPAFDPEAKETAVLLLVNVIQAVSEIMTTQDQYDTLMNQLEKTFIKTADGLDKVIKESYGATGN